MDDSKITILILSSIVSLIVAIISLINSLIVNRQNIKSTKYIERIKMQFEEQKILYTDEKSHFNLILNALNDSIRLIQKVKDTIQLITNCSEKGVSSKSALLMVKEIRTEFFQHYEEQLPHLEKHIIAQAHKAKNETHNLEMLLELYLKDKEYTSDINDEQRNRLAQLRESFNEFQNFLRDQKFDIISRKILNYGGSI